MYHILHEYSKEKDISINSLVNSVLKRYVSWERYAEEIGFIPLARDTVRRVFDEIDDAKLQRIAQRLGRTIPRESILLMFNRIDFNSVMSFLEITLSRYGMVQHQINGDAHDFILHHNVNKKFSNFLAEVAKAMADDLSLKIWIQNADSRLLFISFREISD